MNLVTKLVYLRKNTHIRILRKLYTKLISLAGADIPDTVSVGNNVRFCHNCLGSVIYDGTIIGDNVQIYQNVTIGQADIVRNSCKRFEIREGAVLCAGAKVLGKSTVIVGKNTIVAANAVLLCSTGDNEIWAGVPARLIKKIELPESGV